MELDLTDRKILHELDLNSREPVSIIAKKLKISRDVVNYRLGKLVQEKVIQKFFTIMDISRLGFFANKFFIRFQNITSSKEQEFYNFVEKHPEIIYCAGYDGKFDCVISIRTRNVEELAKILEEIDKKFGKYIAERQIATILRGEYFARDCLTGNRNQRKQYSFGSTPNLKKIDEIDEKILVELGRDARVSCVEIAGKLKISADSVSKRIRKLENSGVIQNYDIVPNEENYPFIHDKILILLHNLDEEKEKKLEKYFRENKNIWYFCKTLGNWNYEVDLDVESQKELRDFLRKIKEVFSDIIKEYSVLSCFKTVKYNFYPSVK